MFKKAIILLPLFIFLMYGSLEVRVKDISYIQGIRKNQIRGYGLVVGLAGTGDSAGNNVTRATLNNFFNNIGLSVGEGAYKTKNMAVVIVTADIEGFVANGERLSVSVASIGDAKSIEGGVLLQTPLKAADGQTYAVAQGAVVVSSKESGLTVGEIPDGAIAERELTSEYLSEDKFTLVLNNADFQTMNNLVEAISSEFSTISLNPMDSKSLEVSIPKEFTNHVEFVSRLQSLSLNMENKAKVVIDERSGVVVMGEDVRVSAIGLSVGSIKIRVGKDENPPNRNNAIEESTDVETLIGSLNDLGIDVKDVIQVLLALKKAGAINAEILVR